MSRNPFLLYSSLFLTALLAGLHFLAHTYDLYWLYWWYDWMMHFLAGLAVGLVAYWLIFDSGLWRRRTDAILLPILTVLVCLIVVGAAWEVFEWMVGLTDAHESDYVDDIAHDLIADTAGALLAGIMGVRRTLSRQSSPRSL